MKQVQKKIPERIVGFAEGIDDEAVALVFSKLQNFPQFKIIRKIPLNAVLKNIPGKNSRILVFRMWIRSFPCRSFQEN